jgi:Tol biopolymer transport system component
VEADVPSQREARRRRGGGRLTRRVVAAVAAVVVVTAASGCTAPRWQAQLASANAAGTSSGNGASWTPQLSPDGTKVVFASWASDLGPTDANAKEDIYVRDLTTGTTRLVSANAAGTGSGNGRSRTASFSPDGTKVLFGSDATDLTATPTTGGQTNLFMRDLATGRTTLVSATPTGAGGDGATTFGRMSPDGRRVLFGSDANDLAGTPTDAWSHVYERDLVTGVTTRLAAGYLPTYSPSGDAVAFMHDHEAYLRDAATGAITPLSAGLPGTTDDGLIVFSPDGRRVAFERRTNVTFVRTDIFVYDRVARTTRLATVGTGGTVSADNTPTRALGFHPTDSTKLLFASRASNLVANDTNGHRDDIFLRDLATGTTRLVSTNAAGTGSPGGDSRHAQWMGDGSKVAIVTSAQELGPADTNTDVDVYTRDMATGAYALVSANAAGTNGGAGASGLYRNPPLGFTTYGLSLSADGSVIAFGSDATNLGPVDPHRADPHDVYVARFTTPPS